MAGFAALLVAAAMASSCGNPRPPEPPALEVPKPVRDLRAVRKGDKVSLSWTVPTRTTEAQTIRYMGATRICRGLDAVMKECGTPAGESPAPDLSILLAANRQGKVQSATYMDTIPPPEIVPATATFTYAVEVLNQSQRSAGISNQVSVSAAPTLPPPSEFKARLQADGVELSWDAISPDPDTAQLRHLYRIYRREQNGSDIVIANLPMGSTDFLDHNFIWEKTYQYRADVVTEIANPASNDCSAQDGASTTCVAPVSIEGDDTPQIEVFAHDIFPPSVPSGLQAVFSENGAQKFIDLIWSPDSEPDLAGYNIFRRQDGGESAQINSQPVKTPAYRDTNVQSGKKYFYSVSAVDVRGNQSAPSQEATESTP